MVADAMLPGLLTEFRAQDSTSVRIWHYLALFLGNASHTEAGQTTGFSVCNAQHALSSLSSLLQRLHIRAIPERFLREASVVIGVY